MARRAILAGVALAGALNGFVVSPPASAADDYCGSGLPSAGAMAGYVGFGDDTDWWRHPVVPGEYLVTLVSGPADADLTVGDSGCGTLCGSSTLIGPDVCTAKTDGWELTIGIWSGSERLSAYSVVVAPIGPNRTACADTVDNDLDGFIDGGDAGCTGPWDNSEDASQCSTTPGGEVCAEVVVGGVRGEYLPYQPGMREYKVGGLVNLYRFPQFANVHLACVVVIVQPGVYRDPCKDRGGRFVSTLHTVHYVPAPGPDASRPPESLLRICDADVSFMVDGAVGERFPALVECRTPDADE